MINGSVREIANKCISGFNICGKNEHWELKFNLSFHQFKWNDEIALTRLIIQSKSSKAKMFALIEFDLVDLS